MPSTRMMETAQTAVKDAIAKGLLIDGFVSHPSDDIAMLMSPTRGKDNTELH